MSVHQAKTRISLGIRPVWSGSSLSAWRKLGSLATHWVYSEDWSDWADAQADLSLRWAHNHFVGFVMSRLKHGLLLHFAGPLGSFRHRFSMPVSGGPENVKSMFDLYIRLRPAGILPWNNLESISNQQFWESNLETISDQLFFDIRTAFQTRTSREFTFKQHLIII